MDLTEVSKNILGFQKRKQSPKAEPHFGAKPTKPNLAEIKIDALSIEAAAQTLYEALSSRKDCWGFGFSRERNNGTVIYRTDGERANAEQIERFMKSYWDREMPEDLKGKTMIVYVKFAAFLYPSNFPASKKTEWREF